MEVAPRAALYGAPRHPYTRALLAANPVPDPEPFAAHGPDPRRGSRGGPMCRKAASFGIAAHWPWPAARRRRPPCAPSARASSPVTAPTNSTGCGLPPRVGARNTVKSCKRRAQRANIAPAHEAERAATPIINVEEHDRNDESKEPDFRIHGGRRSTAAGCLRQPDGARQAGDCQHRKRHLRCRRRTRSTSPTSSLRCRPSWPISRPPSTAKDYAGGAGQSAGRARQRPRACWARRCSRRKSMVKAATAEWPSLAAAVPAMVTAVTNRATALGKSKHAPAGVDMDAAKSAVADADRCLDQGAGSQHVGRCGNGRGECARGQGESRSRRYRHEDARCRPRPRPSKRRVGSHPRRLA